MLRNLFFILCLSLCLYQISKICEIYFSYKTSISMSYQNISEISIPALSICVDKSFLLNSNHLTKLGIKTQVESGRHSSRIGKYLNNMTIIEQIEAMATKEDIFPESCPIRSKESNNSNKIHEIARIFQIWRYQSTLTPCV